MAQKMSLYLSNGFVAENPEVSRLLLMVSETLDAKTTLKKDRRIFVFKGCLPEKPLHPRLTFAAVSKEEITEKKKKRDDDGAQEEGTEKKKKKARDGAQFLDFQGLLAKLTSVRGLARSLLQ